MRAATRESRWSAINRIVVTIVALVLSTLGLWFTITSAAPLPYAEAAPTAVQVGAGRDAYHQLLAGTRDDDERRHLRLGGDQLAGLSALASHGFRPDRFTMTTHGSEFRIDVSHRLPMRRWLNVTVRAESPSAEFPKTRISIGLWGFPPTLSRLVFEAARSLSLMRHIDLPPLDKMIRNFQVQNGTISAILSLPPGILDQVAGAVALPINSNQVLAIYCALATAQQQRPSGEFVEHVRRAFSGKPETTTSAGYNAAAFVALGMLLVDERVGDLARVTGADIARCHVQPITVAIYGRSDWPKHWILSAALAVSAGTQLSEAAGEWKELADSLAQDRRVSIGDPGGFSMADLAADRAGFRIARLATEAGNADRMAAQLSKAIPQQLLPHQLVTREDSLTNRDFTLRYGAIDDSRFHNRLKEIDSVLETAGLH